MSVETREIEIPIDLFDRITEMLPPEARIVDLNIDSSNLVMWFPKLRIILKGSRKCFVELSM